MKGTME